MSKAIMSKISNHNHTKLAKIAVSFASVTALLLPATSLASTTASASSSIYGITGGPSDSKSMNGGNGQTASANVSVAGADSVASATASTSASAAEGLLNVSFENYATGGSWGNARGDSYARASWNDYLTINAGSAMLGQSGHVIATINFTGTFGGELGPIGPHDSAEHYEGINVLGTGIVGTDSTCGGWSLCTYQDIYTWGPPRTHSSITSVIALDIPVIFGSANGISYTLDLSGLALEGNVYGGGTWAHAFASEALAWGGITGVYDASGNVVSNFSATSTSGFDYNAAPHPVAAVPEPETYAMMLAGLGLLGFMTQHRKQKESAA